MDKVIQVLSLGREILRQKFQQKDIIYGQGLLEMKIIHL